MDTDPGEIRLNLNKKKSSKKIIKIDQDNGGVEQSAEYGILNPQFNDTTSQNSPISPSRRMMPRRS